MECKSSDLVLLLWAEAIGQRGMMPHVKGFVGPFLRLERAGFLCYAVNGYGVEGAAITPPGMEMASALRLHMAVAKGENVAVETLSTMATEAAHKRGRIRG